jgi:hypothetical protein
MEEKTYNQQQYLNSHRRKTTCRYCKQQIIWMRTIDHRAIPVNPLKVFCQNPGQAVLDEIGMIMVFEPMRAGWIPHECKGTARRIGGLSQSRDVAADTQQIGLQYE